MKKIVLNLICAVLAIKDITIGEKGEASITEDQLNQLENALKEKDDRISALETEKQTAINDKQTAEKAMADAQQNLNKLQKEFDDFKAEAGADTGSKPAGDEGTHAPKTAKDMYNGIKNLL
jgi:chromosome segregation ATPase